MRDILISGQFILTLSFNDGIVNKIQSYWTEEDKRKVQLGFKVKNLLIDTLNSKIFYYVFTCDYAKKV